jgi:DNA polymerase III subunit gamma/tau
MKQPYRIKYRPNMLSDMIGIDKFIPQLKYIIENKSLAPILVSGPNGSGKSTLLSLILKRMHCLNPDKLDHCNDCENCKSIDLHYGSLDHYVYSGDELNLNKLDKLIGRLYYYTNMLEFPSVFIDDLDHSSEENYQRLIRTVNIHEGTLFLFSATNLKKILPPLLQRCMHLQLNSYSIADLKMLIKRITDAENILVEDEESVEKLIKLANRNPRNIVNALEAIKSIGASICDDTLKLPTVKSNLGFFVGESRMILD